MMALFDAIADAPVRPVPREAQGTYCCFVRELTYWYGPKAGETQQLDGGDWELDVITGRQLLWEYEDANSVHNGLPLKLDYRPADLAQLVAWRPDGSLVLRIGLEPGAETTRFTGLGTHAAISGICYFKPQAT